MNDTTRHCDKMFTQIVLYVPQDQESIITIIIVVVVYYSTLLTEKTHSV